MFGHPLGKFMIKCMIAEATDLHGKDLIKMSISLFKNVMSEF